jgi:hypothetical protein
MKRILYLSLFVLLGLVPFKTALAQIAISVNFAPPALPVYEQPACPEDGYIWVPGYWAWDADYEDYYWVPGTWVPSPEEGYLWTPPWWGWENGAYLFHDGYWAPQVGFYGGVNYGYGYFGHGFEGGRWQNNHFFYNTAVMRVNTTVIRNVYVDKTVIVNNNVHVAYNGGQGGIQARPTQQEEAVAQMRHVPPPAQQEQRREMARSNPQMRASANHGRPPVAATARPTDFKGSGVVAARAAGAPYHPLANRAQAHGASDKPSNSASRPANETARPTNENRHPEENTPARPAPAERPSPAERTQPKERPNTKPETTSRPEQRTEQQPERKPATKQERPAPKTTEHPSNAQRPAARPKPQSKPKPEDKREPR